MKVKLNFKAVALSAIFICSSFIGNAQKLIVAADITPELLKNICEDAAIKVEEAKDNYLKIKDRFTFYIDIDKEKRFLFLNTSYPLVAGTTAAQALALMNKLNREIIMVKFYYIADKNTINYNYDFWTENGFSNRTFINVIKMFSSALSLALEKDTEKLIK